MCAAGCGMWCGPVHATVAMLFSLLQHDGPHIQRHSVQSACNVHCDVDCLSLCTSNVACYELVILRRRNADLVQQVGEMTATKV